MQKNTDPARMRTEVPKALCSHRLFLDLCKYAHAIKEKKRTSARLLDKAVGSI